MKSKLDLYKSIFGGGHVDELAEQLGEVALDSLLNEGVLKEIPVLGTALSLFKAGNHISAYFLARKIIIFLTQLESTTFEEREAFIKKYSYETTDKESIGETTLILLDRIDNSMLAEFLGKAFNLLLKDKIDKNIFEIYSYIIKDLNPYLVRQITQYYGIDGMSAIDAPAAIQLSNYGIVKLDSHLRVSSGIRQDYYKTDFGTKFYNDIIRK